MGAYEWTNHPPQGHHEGAEGVVNSAACTAFGWALDADDPNRDIQVRVLADGVQVAASSANLYRDDLEAFARMGPAPFSVDLRSLISSGEEHIITVEAYNLEGDDWWTLAGTPKTLTCQGGNLYLPALMR
jgi:hypothetical protein